MSSTAFSPSPSLGHQKKFGQYTDSSSKTLIGLQKVNIQLQKEIDCLEKQQKTAVNNISNHQQALKMSWRRLEHQRNNMTSSPLLTRATTAPANAPSRQPRRGILQSNTRLCVGATPQVYGVDGGSPSPFSTSSSSAVQLTVTPAEGESATELGGPSALAPPSLLDNKYIRSSPYISSPFVLRKESVPRPATSSSSESDGAGRSSSGNEPSETRSPVPPPSTLVVTTKSSQKKGAIPLGKLTDKQTLMEASALLGVDGTASKGPAAFQGFYSSEAGGIGGLSVHSVVVSPIVARGEGNGDVGKEKEGDELSDDIKTSSEPSLAEMFEQIKHCRYIRHYRPDGTEIEEYA